MLLENKSAYRLNFIAALLLTVVLLFVQKDNYWRPYIYTGQESIGSGFAHGCALANEIGLKQNPFMTHEVDFLEHKIIEYSHWPNGHFFLLYICIKLFGNTEFTGRSLALALNLLGAFFLALSFRDKKGFVFYCIPLLLLTPIGRDAIPYVFIEPSFHFWIGFTAFSVSFVESLSHQKTSRILFRLAAILAPFFAHLMLWFLFFGAVARFLFHRNKKELLIDILIIFASVAGVLIALSFSQQGFVNGLTDLYLHFLHRSNIRIRFQEEAPVHLVQLADTMIYKLRHNLLIFWYLLPLGWLYCVAHRKSVSFVFLAAVFNIIIMSNYVYPHVFAQYNFILISLFTVFYFLSNISERMLDSAAPFFTRENLIMNQRTTQAIAKVAVLGSVYLFSCYELRTNTTSYQVDPEYVKLRNTLMALKDDIQYSKCNCFGDSTFKHVKLYGQFFLGEKVIESLKKNEPKICGDIDFDRNVLYCP